MATKHVNNVLHYNCSFDALYYVLKLGKYPWALAAQYGITTISYFNHITYFLIWKFYTSTLNSSNIAAFHLRM